MGDFMIEGHYKASASLGNMLDTSSTASSDSKKSRKTRKKNRWQPYTVPSRRTFGELATSGGLQPSCTYEEWPSDSPRRLETPADKDITNLPDELIIKILSNLNIRDISVCKRINRSWQELVDTNHLQELSFGRCLHFQPISQTVKNYQSLTRGWLTGFSNRGKELAQQLDNFLGNKHFPEILFFNIAKVLTKTKLLICQNVCTFRHPDSVHINPIFSPDGNHLVTASDNETAEIWELAAGQLQHKATIRHHNWLINISFSPDGSHLVTDSDKKTAEIWGLVAGHWQHKVTIRHSVRLAGFSFSPDGSRLVTACYDGTAKIWELVTEQWQHKATIEPSNWVNNVSFSPDGTHIVTISNYHTTRIWEIAAGQWREKATSRHSGWVKCVSFSPDGSHLVIVATSNDHMVTSNDHTAEIWGLVAGQWQHKATICHAEWVRGISFSPDGSHLVIGFDFDTAKIWGVIAGQWQEQATIPLYGSISNASFSPDGSHLVTANLDTAIIWGVVGGQWKEKATLRHSNRVRSASFSPDGIHVLTLSGDDITKIWLLAGC